MKMIDLNEMRKDMEAGTQGDWIAPYELFDNGWSLDTECENTFVGIGPKCDREDMPPIAVTAVESAFGMDHVVDANARRIARLPELEREYLALREAADALADEVDRIRLNRVANMDTLNRELAAYRKATE